MAEGRMLKKQISQSRRLADLKTDSARLLYTWIIPHLDIEGRMSADPYVIKGQVVPRLKQMTPEKIEQYLLDMNHVEIIVLYEHDGDKYLQLRKFKDHQSLRKDKEAISRIPPPDISTPVEVPDKDGNSTDEDKLSKEKISKDKYCDCVFLFEDQYKKLLSKYGEIKTNKMIEELNNYKMSSGKKYKSDYHALIGWVAKKFETESSGGQYGKQQSELPPDAQADIDKVNRMARELAEKKALDSTGRKTY